MTTKLSKKSDLYKEIFLYLILGLIFMLFGIIFLILQYNIPIGVIIVCSIFIFSGLCLVLKSFKIFFVYFILNVPYEYYITTIKRYENTKEGRSMVTTTLKRKGSEIGLPDRFDDLTKSQITALQNNTFVIPQDLQYNKESFRKVHGYNYGQTDEKNAEIHNDIYEYNRKASFKEENEGDPFENYYNKGDD